MNHATHPPPMLFTAPATLNEPDERYTPAWLFTALGETFDLDPAHPAEHPTHVPTVHHYTRADDGLAQPWFGFVWCNPPFSNATAFADRFLQHGNGIWLGPIANGAWFQRMSAAADRVWLMRDFAFIHPEHKGKRSGMPLAVIGLGDRAAAAIDRAAATLPAAGVVCIRTDHVSRET